VSAPEATISQLAAALRYAALGWQVIPLHTPGAGGACSCERADCERSSGKHPRFADWVKRATTDADAIRGWWRTWPAANVGLVTGARSGFFVLDVDPEHGGEATLALLVAEHEQGLPQTVEAITGSGGRHLLFKYPGHHVPNSTSKLGPGLDVRGDGGQIVAAPSQHRAGSAYEWQPECAPGAIALADAPAWLLDALRAEPPRAPAPSPRPTPTDTLRRASLYLARVPAAISGSGGHDQAWRAALAVVRGFALNESDAYSLLATEYNSRCVPPWSERELRHKVQSAGRDARLPEGYLRDAPRRDERPPPASASAPAAAPQQAQVQAQPTRLGLQPVSILLAETIPPTEWLLAPWLEAKTIAAMVAPPNLGKTLLAFWIATQVAAAGHRVAIIEEEGGRRGFQRRIDRAIRACGGGEERIDYAFKPRLSLMRPADIDAMCRELVGYALVVIDSLARVITGVDENDTREMGQVVDALDRVREGTGASALSLHHTGKSKWKPGEVPRLEDGRGSSALAAGLDTVLALAPVEGREPGIVKFELHVTKQRDEDNQVSPRLVRIAMTGPAAAVDMEEIKLIDSVSPARQRVESILHLVLNAIPEPPSTPISRNALQDALGKRRADVQAAVALLIDRRKVKELSRSRLIRIPSTPERQP
jgi:hypothetical protein